MITCRLTTPAAKRKLGAMEKHLSTALLLFTLVVCVCGHIPYYDMGACGSHNYEGEACEVRVKEPWVSQVFYERVGTETSILYTSDEDQIDYVQILIPSDQDRTMCRHVSVEIQKIDADKKTEVLYDLSVYDEKITDSMLEPFTQTAVSQIGSTWESGIVNGDTESKFYIIVNNTADKLYRHQTCHVAVVVGKEEQIPAWVLFEFPYITLKTWSWAWSSMQYSGLVGGYIFVAFLIAFVLTAIKGGKTYCVEFTARFMCHLSLGFYVAVLLARITSALMARRASGDGSAGSAGWVFLIVCIDVIYTLLIAVACFGEQAADLLQDGVNCCPTFCCGCNCCIRLLKKETPIKLVALFLLFIIGFFAFSPGFYIGPICMTIAIILSYMAVSYRESSYTKW